MYLPQSGWASSLSFSGVVSRIGTWNREGVPEFTQRDRLKKAGVCDAPDFKGKCTRTLRSAFDEGARKFGGAGQAEKYRGLFPSPDRPGAPSLIPGLDVPIWIPIVGFAVLGTIVYLVMRK